MLKKAKKKTLRIITYVFYVKVSMQKKLFLDITKLPFGINGAMAISIR